VRDGVFKIACLALLLILLPAGRKGDQQPATPTEKYAAAVREDAAGKRANAFKLYLEAAGANVVLAQIQVARMYAAGQDVARDDAKAFEYYRRVAEPNEDMDRASSLAPVVGEAFLALSKYLRTGMPQAGIAEDKKLASKYLSVAAMQFQNPEAQFELAMSYQAGDGVEQNLRAAVIWLVNSARKRYAMAQAELGDMQWKGQQVKQARAEGLAMLALARDNALPNELPLIDVKYRNALAEADNDTIAKADIILRTQASGLRKKDGILQIQPSAPPLRDPMLIAGPDDTKNRKDPGTPKADGVMVPTLLGQ
jgi:TPR repeat protein